MSSIKFKSSGSPPASHPSEAMPLAGAKRKVDGAAQRIFESPSEKRRLRSSPPKLPQQRPYRHLLAFYGVDFDRGEGDDVLKNSLLKVEARLKGQPPAVMISVRKKVRGLIDNEPRVRDCALAAYALYPLDFARSQHEEDLLFDQLYQVEWLLSGTRPDFTPERKEAARLWVSQCIKKDKKIYTAELGLLLHYVGKKHGTLPEANTDYSLLLNTRIYSLIGDQFTSDTLSAFLREFVDVILLPGRVVNIGGARAMKSLLCSTRAACFEEYYRYQLAVFCQDLIENQDFSEEIEGLPLEEALHPEVATLMRQELGLSHTAPLDSQRVIEATMLCFLRPIRQNKLGNCYVIGPLQSLAYQYPQRVFKLFLNVFTNLIVPRESGKPEDLLAGLHREIHPETPLTLQELLFRACEFLCINHAKSCQRMFKNWLLNLVDFPVFEESFPFDLFIATVTRKLIEHCYFVDTMQSNHSLKIVWTDGESSQVLASAEELRLKLITALEALSSNEPALAPHLKKLTTFLRSPSSTSWVELCFQSNRLPGQGHFEEFFGLAECQFQKERVQIDADLFLAMRAIAARSERGPLLVGVPEHGLITHPRGLAPYREALLERYQTLILARGQALLSRPLPLNDRKKITALLRDDTAHPPQETLEDFCARIEPIARETDQLELFRLLVNDAVRLVPLDALEEMLSSVMSNHAEAAQALQNHFSAHSTRIVAHECAHFLRHRFGTDPQEVERALCAAKDIPESWELGDLFWSDGEGDYGPGVFAFVTYDVLSKGPALLFRGLTRVWFEPASFLGQEIEFFAPS